MSADPGVWRPVCYVSGTVTVEDGKASFTKYGVKGVGPHVRILYRAYGGDAKRDDIEVSRERFVIAEKIAALLNRTSSNRGFLKRTGEVNAIADTGQCIEVSGPMVDADPPNCFWKLDESDAAQSARARLMDAIFGIGVTREGNSDER